MCTNNNQQLLCKILIGIQITLLGEVFVVESVEMVYIPNQVYLFDIPCLLKKKYINYVFTSIVTSTNQLI